MTVDELLAHCRTLGEGAARRHRRALEGPASRRAGGGASPAAARSAADELRRLAAGLERAFGLGVTAAALAKSIETWNELRARLRALYAFRIEAPQRLSTVELYSVLRAAAAAPPEDSVDRLDALLAGLPAQAARPRDRLRVVVEGAFCEQPPLALLEVLEEAGCYVVEDDPGGGVRGEDVDLRAHAQRGRDLRRVHAPGLRAS